MNFKEKMLIESTQNSDDFKTLEKLIEDSDELSESGVLAALAAKLGLAGAVGSAGGGFSGALGSIGGGAIATAPSAAGTGGIIAAGSASITAPFALLLASLGVAWVGYLVTKKAFKIMFLAKVKKCLGDKVAKEAKDLVVTVGKLPKGNRQHDEAVTKLDVIKADLLKKCGKK